MNILTNKSWWMASITRAIKTVCQTAVALIGTEALGIIDIDWLNVLSVAGLAGFVSILTSVAGIPEVKYKEIIEENNFDEGGEGNDSIK